MGKIMAITVIFLLIHAGCGSQGGQDAGSNSLGPFSKIVNKEWLCEDTVEDFAFEMRANGLMLGDGLLNQAKWKPLSPTSISIKEALFGTFFHWFNMELNDEILTFIWKIDSVDRQFTCKHE